ncbi:MAG TPA: LamG-like jellyroll fold domain-containing protein [Kofleriaceae bacterium]|jgi:hypothetical protein
MRFLLVAAVIGTACSVPAKQAPSDGSLAADSGSSSPIGSNGPLDTTIDTEPALFSNVALAQFTFHSNDSTATFECVIDTQAAQPCSSPFAQTLADGSHTFSVRAEDGNGSVDDTPAEYVWTIDTVPPDTMLTVAPPASDNSVMVEFDFTSNEDNTTFECSLDNAGFVACASGSLFGPVGNGPHTFAVRARDRAGNVDPTPATYSWTVDTSTPDTQIDSGPTGSTRTTTASFTFTSPDAGAGATFQCSLDGAAFAACTSPFTTPTLAQGSHTFEVRVTDAVGNVDPTPATRTWIVDLTPPDTTIVSGPTGTVPVASASFTFSSSESNSTFSCSLDGVPAAACTSPFNVENLAQGAHTFTVVATDAAGNVDPTPATRSWTVDTIAPTISISSGPANGSTSGPYVTFAFSVSDGTVTCSVDNGAFAACASPASMNLPAGAHSFEIKAQDTAGNVATATRTWTVACAPPAATGAAGQLHLDDTGQTLANAVAGGAAAVLGTTTAVEPDDPAEIASGRFGGALAFTAANGDVATWPAALPAASALTIEMWVSPNATAGTGTLFASGDGRVVVSVTADSPTLVHFTFSLTNGTAQIVSSASVPSGQWHHVLVSFADPSMRMWVDGVRTELDTAHAGTPFALTSITLGGSGASAYGGNLDEVWLAETAITADADALARYCPL